MRKLHRTGIRNGLQRRRATSITTFTSAGTGDNSRDPQEEDSKPRNGHIFKLQDQWRISYSRIASDSFVVGFASRMAVHRANYAVAFAFSDPPCIK